MVENDADVVNGIVGELDKLYKYQDSKNNAKTGSIKKSQKEIARLKKMQDREVEEQRQRALDFDHGGHDDDIVRFKKSKNVMLSAIEVLKEREKSHWEIYKRDLKIACCGIKKKRIAREEQEKNDPNFQDSVIKREDFLMVKMQRTMEKKTDEKTQRNVD